MHSFKLEFLDYQPRVMFSFLDILGKDIEEDIETKSEDLDGVQQGTRLGPLLLSTYSLA